MPLAIFASSGLKTVFENLEGFPKDWKTNAPAFIKFVREHHCPSFLEYGEYPYVSADEIKKALKLKAAFSRHARPDAIDRGHVEGRLAIAIYNRRNLPCWRSTTFNTSC